MYLVTHHDLLYVELNGQLNSPTMENLALYEDFSEACDATRKLVKERLEWLRVNVTTDPICSTEIGGGVSDSQLSIWISNIVYGVISYYKVTFVPIIS